MSKAGPSLFKVCCHQLGQHCEERVLFFETKPIVFFSGTRSTFFAMLDPN